MTGLDSNNSRSIIGHLVSNQPSKPPAEVISDCAKLVLNLLVVSKNLETKIKYFKVRDRNRNLAISIAANNIFKKSV